jgi:hypothetical protein
MLFIYGGQKTILRNLSLNLGERPRVEERLEAQRTTDVQFILELDKLDKVEYPRLAMNQLC